MLKMYHRQSHSGSSPDHWEENWRSADFEEGVKFCAIDPLRPLFEKYLRPDSLMLEGGCGMGNYLAYYAARGYRVVGLDFAQSTLKALHARQPEVNLCGGDVSRLPFADDSFDLYYSGGVVEHFEGGAEDALKEAARVLKKDGILLLSVPYQSPLRTMLAPLKKSSWRKVFRSETGEGNTPDDKKFFQYAYRRREFEKLLAKAGLRVIKTQGYAVVWGLYDIPLLNSESMDFESRNEALPANGRPKENSAAVKIDDLVADQKISLLKRLVISEDAAVPVAGVLIKFMRWFSANMMMYVCVRDPKSK